MKLGGAEEIVELGLEDAFAAAICVVEWADRLGPAMPPRALLIDLDFAEATGEARRASIRATGGGWGWLAGVLAEVGAAP